VSSFRGAPQFYVANPAVPRMPNTTLPFVDEIIVPSQFVADLCEQILGKSAHVLRNIVPRVFDGRVNLASDRISSRGDRFVTMINPSPQKGGLFFINIAAQVAQMVPHVKFRAVESRWGRRNWEALAVPEADLDRIDWHPHTQDMTRIYEEASLLLVPSLWEEASARVIAEALLAGVPVLAMRNGGMPEQLGEGGFLFDVPSELAANHLATPPSDHVLRWSEFVKVLMEKDALYASAVALALRESERMAPHKRAAAAVQLFTELLEALDKAASGGDCTLTTALRQYRDAMAQEREAINARVEAGQDADTALAEDTPYLPLLQRSLAQPAIKGALAVANAKDWARARDILERYLRLVPEDLTALAMMAEVADAQEREGEALQFLQRLVDLAPGFLQGQQRLLAHLRRTGNPSAALAQSKKLLARVPDNPRYQALHAGLLTTANRFNEAITLYETCFATYPGSAHDWMQYALALKTLGRQSEGIEAYRKAIEIAPKHGAAWHGLSNMKLAVFEQADIDYMEYLISEKGLSDDDLSNVHFTLGKAYEDAKSYAASFEHYARANAIRRARNDYDVGRIEDYVAQAKETFTSEFFAARIDFGHKATDPVFVLGLHRAGSTLTEQILASHSQIEGTRELPYMLRIGRDFGGLGPRGQERGLIADLLRDLSPEECVDLGQTYLDLSRPERLTERLLFIDKMPANWMYTGLIHLILPNAKIIDIRRKPMAAGFALFKMNFGQGVDHSYDQGDIARYYRAYAELMTHFDAVLPGRVHHIQYETLVENPEPEIRCLIDYCDLPFEEGCLRYWETERAIQTPSSEQVRQPIFKGAMDQWTHYAQWLGPMRAAFGDLVAQDGEASRNASLVRAGV
jgi:tetratricopeptide (TPR) repeat protein